MERQQINRYNLHIGIEVVSFFFISCSYRSIIYILSLHETRDYYEIVLC